VRRIDDHASALWGTPGYQAPELETQGASVASDIYTIGRTLAVLSFDFGGFSTVTRRACPIRVNVALLAEQESYHRLLLRATHTDPRQRFDSAGELAEQALGVLREVLSTGDGVPRPAASGSSPRNGVRSARPSRRSPLWMDRPWRRRCRCRWSTRPTSRAGFLATLGGNRSTRDDRVVGGGAGTIVGGHLPPHPGPSRRRRLRGRVRRAGRRDTRHRSPGGRRLAARLVCRP